LFERRSVYVFVIFLGFKKAKHGFEVFKIMNVWYKGQEENRLKA